MSRPSPANRRSYLHVFLPLGSTSIASPGVRGSRSLPFLSASIDAGVNVADLAITDSFVGSRRYKIMRQIVRQLPSKRV